MSLLTSAETMSLRNWGSGCSKLVERMSYLCLKILPGFFHNFLSIFLGSVSFNRSLVEALTNVALSEPGLMCSELAKK